MTERRQDKHSEPRMVSYSQRIDEIAVARFELHHGAPVKPRIDWVKVLGLTAALSFTVWFWAGVWTLVR